MNDLVGQEEVRILIQEQRDFYNHQELYKYLNTRAKQVILLYGPPGCGKTLTAKIMANELGMNFIETAGTRFMDGYLAHGAQAVRNLFAQAKANAPCLIFIDEFDSLAQQRT